GGGSYIPPSPETKVTFSGRAYPNSTVTLLKDAQIAATTIADANANFQISLSGLSSGNFIFSIYSEDKEGNRSSLFTFPVSVTLGTNIQIGGIFIAPTIDVDKIEVKRGDNLAIFGQSCPDAEITIVVSSGEDIFRKIQADKNGIYLYNFDTAILEMGQHFAKSKSAYITETSSYSKTVGFLVSTKTVFKKPSKCLLKGDLNNDCRVNLIDFSIAAYWYKRPNPPPTVDLNGDGKVDLVDFSIMAYFWTG
ncbi:MAG: dockerin type I domain-containing protein, partial [Patescibacteria group bacterium]